jgi:ABC-type multidrug transport system fused ATPase/permease subunit
MKEHVGSLTGGLGHEIQGDGCNLSFGQRQLLCMARMVIRQPALILLDEATSALDPATQQQVQYTVEKYFPNSTMFMVAHRLETIANFDKVMVMDRGRIAEQGPPAELREKGGIFTKMWEAKQTW